MINCREKFSSQYENRFRPELIAAGDSLFDVRGALEVSGFFCSRPVVGDLGEIERDRGETPFGSSRSEVCP